MPRLTRVAVLLVAAALAAPLGLAACGGGGDGSSSSARAELKRAFSGDHEIRSGRLELALHADVKGVPSLAQPLDLRLAGPFQSTGATTLPHFNFELTFGGGGAPVSLGMISTGQAGFLSLEGQAYDLGTEAYTSLQQGYAESQKQSRRQQRGTPGLSALGVDPERWVTDPRHVGREDIAGTETDHLVADVDVDALLKDVDTLLRRSSSVAGATGRQLPGSLTADQRDAIAASVKDATVDVWVGRSDHALRRFNLHVGLDAPDDARERLGGLKTGSITLGMTLAQLNQAQTIAAPKDAKSLEELQAALVQSGLLRQKQQQGQGAGQGSSSGGSGTTSTPAPDTPAPTGTQGKYLKCLQDAGEDLAEIQRCAAILEK